MTDTPNTPAPRRTATWVKVLLGLSLALNLAIVGLIAGFALRGGPGAGSRAAMSYGLPYVAALPKEERRALWRQMRAEGVVSDRSARRALHTDMLGVLRAQTFVVDDAKRILNAQAEAALAAQTGAQDAWLTWVTALPAADRAAYADRVEEMLRRGPRKSKRQ